MRFRLSVRVALVGVAVAALALFAAMELWRGGAFAFQREHAEIARVHFSRYLGYHNKLSHCRAIAAAYSPGSLLPETIQGKPEEVLAALAELEAKARAEEAIVEWHARIAGPSYRWWIYGVW